MKKILSVFLRCSISIAFLIILFRKIDFKDTFKLLLTLNPIYSIYALVFFFIIYVLVLYRWKMLLDAQGVRLPFKRVVSSYAGGLFFSLFLPSTIGGDIARSVDLSIYAKSRSVIVASVLLDRLSGFVGLVVVAFVGLMVGHRFIKEPSVYFTIFLMAALLGAMLLVIFNQGIYRRISRPSLHKNAWKERLKKLHAEIYFFRSKPLVLYLNLFCSILIQVGASVVSYFLLRALNAKMYFFYPLIFNPVITVITTIPIAIGGLGLRDAASIFFYTKVGIAKDVALGQALLTFALIVLFGLIGGIVYVSTLHYRRVQPHQTDAAS